MSERLQLILSLASLGLVVVAGVLVFRFTSPSTPREALAPLPRVSRPETVSVWLSPESLSGLQLVFKPYLDSAARDRFNNTTLSRRLGAPEDAYRFYRVLVVNFDPAEPLDLAVDRLRFVATDRSGGTIASIDPARLLAEGDGSISGAERVVLSALGLRPGPYRLPPRSAGSFVVAFPAEAEPAQWRRLALELGERSLPLELTEVPRVALDRFRLDPAEPLVPSRPEEVARRPKEGAPAEAPAVPPGSPRAK